MAPPSPTRSGEAGAKTTSRRSGTTTGPTPWRHPTASTIAASATPADSSKNPNTSALRAASTPLPLRAFPPLLRLPAPVGHHHWPVVVGAPVLGREPDRRPVGLGAEVLAVDHQALLAALHAQDELVHGCVGDDVEGVSDPTFDRVDPSDDVHGRDPVQGPDQVGELVVG